MTAAPGRPQSQLLQEQDEEIVSHFVQALRAGDQDLADQLYKLIPRDDPDRPSPLYEAATQAYENGEIGLLKQLYGTLHWTNQYRLLARARVEDNQPMYRELLARTTFPPGRLLAVTGISPLMTQIYLEHAPVDDQEIVDAVVDYLQVPRDVTVQTLDLLLARLQDKQRLAILLPDLLARPGDFGPMVAATLVSHGVKPTDPRLVRALRQLDGSPGWALLRNMTIWLDLPYRVVVELQQRERAYQLVLEAVLGRNLAGYALRAL